MCGRPFENEHSGWGSCRSVHRGDPDEIAVGVGDHERATEDIVVRLLHDVDSLRDPTREDLVNCGRWSRHHQPDLARARGAWDRVLAASCPQREQNAGGNLESNVAGAGEGRFDLEQIAVKGRGCSGVTDVDQEQVGCGHRTLLRSLGSRYRTS
uniref:Uncharacterized protein n=1 Tax=Corynebacterium jeikeium TaxID=38289 RepID=Q83ZR9_CORJE|nr:hypothetical protein [Corynebacterium jeikeium]